MTSTPLTPGEAQNPPIGLTATIRDKSVETNHSILLFFRVHEIWCNTSPLSPLVQCCICIKITPRSRVEERNNFEQRGKGRFNSYVSTKMDNK